MWSSIRETCPSCWTRLFAAAKPFCRRRRTCSPALKQAGVVDSGGQGLLTVLKGWRAAFNGEKIEDTTANIGSAATFEFEDDHESMEEVKFGILYRVHHSVYEPRRDRGRYRQIPPPDLTRIGDLRGCRRRFLRW